MTPVRPLQFPVAPRHVRVWLQNLRRSSYGRGECEDTRPAVHPARGAVPVPAGTPR